MTSRTGFGTRKLRQSNFSLPAPPFSPFTHWVNKNTAIADMEMVKAERL